MDAITKTKNGYTATENGAQLIIPNDAGNADYRRMMADIAAGKAVTDLSVPSIADLRAAANAAMLARINAFLAQFVEGVPPAVVSGWSDKAARARGVIAGTADAALTSEAQMLGVTAAALAAKIIAKAGSYAMITGAVEAIRSNASAAIAVAATGADINNAMAAAMTQAQATASKLGLVF